MTKNNTSLFFFSTAGKLHATDPEGFLGRSGCGEGARHCPVQTWEKQGTHNSPQTETQQRKLWEQKPQVSQLVGNVDKVSIPFLRLGENFPGKEKLTPSGAAAG